MAEKKVVVKRYTVLLTLLSDSAVNVITSALLRRGCGVAPAASSKTLTNGDVESVSKVLAIDVTVDVPEGNAKTNDAAKGWIYNYIKSVLDDTRIAYLSIFMHGDGGMMWSAGNVKVSKEVKAQGPYRTTAS